MASGERFKTARRTSLVFEVIRSRLSDVIVIRILTSRTWTMMKIMAVTSGRGVSSCNKRIKLAVVGDKQVGKTSLISRYVYNSFSQHYTYTQGEWGTYVYIACVCACVRACVRVCVRVCVCGVRVCVCVGGGVKYFE